MLAYLKQLSNRRFYGIWKFISNHFTISYLSGSNGFLLGAIALILPKFGRSAFWHRRVGWVYAAVMLGMGTLSLPLAFQNRDWFLQVIGVVTVSYVLSGWRALRAYMQAQSTGKTAVAGTQIRTHIIMMNSSYIAAWIAFLVNVRPLGDGTAAFVFYAAVPPIVGTLAILRAIMQLTPPPLSGGRAVE